MKLIKYSLLSIFICFAMSALALENDEQQSLTIASDFAEINRANGSAVYQNNVTIDRGTTHARGDKVTTQNDSNNKLQEAIIESFNGHLSQYRTLTDADKPELYAQAKTIKFYPSKNRIVFLGNAKITQGRDSIEGAVLEYDMLNQRLIATNQATPEDDGNQHRTVIVIAPDSSSFMQPSKSSKPS